MTATPEIQMALSASVVLVALLTPIWLRHRARHLNSAADHLTRMGDAAAALIEDPSVEPIVVSFVTNLTKHARDPRLGRFLVWDILTGRFQKLLEAPRTKSVLLLALERLSEERRQDFAEFLVNAVLCSGSSDPLLAMITRRILLWGLSGLPEDVAEPHKAEVVATEVVLSRPELALANA